MPDNCKAHDFRLRKHAEYQRVYKAARKKHGELLAYFFAPRSTGPEGELKLSPEGARPAIAEGPRVGLTVPKALGGAVVRNRIKRRTRAAVRACIPLLSSPVDVILHPRKTVEVCDFTALQREVAVVFRSVQAHILREQATAELRGTSPKAASAGSRGSGGPGSRDRR